MTPDEDQILAQWREALVPEIEPSPVALVLARIAEPLTRARLQAAATSNAELTAHLEEISKVVLFMRALMDARSRDLADMRVRPTDRQMREAEELCRLYVQAAVTPSSGEDVISRILADLRNRAQEDPRAESMTIEALLSLCADLAIFAALRTGAGVHGAVDVTDEVLTYRRADN